MPEPEPVTIESMQPVFDTILSLLARQVFPPDTLKQIVIRQKRRPNDYIKAYNLCDGEHGVTQIAKEIGVSVGTLSPILADWKELGIVYEISRKGAKFYKRLYALKAPKATGDATKENTPEESPEGDTGDHV